ncbi:hypothetical protein ACAH01_08700 [Halomicrobium sp. HM KBTZ05]|uniref:DUF6414 family protein n=1 Tax=Halomicrobium sp. HM KBTZ05 TaxID=3242663 RepID=UPI003558FE43
MSEDSPARADRVPGFVYLDMDRVRSISSRLDEGYVKQQVEEREESEEVAGSIYGNIKAQIFGSFGPSAETGAEVSAGFASGQRFQQNKALHHYYYDILEDWLEGFEGDWFHDVDDMANETGGKSAVPSRFKNEVDEGDIIRVSGNVNLLDFRSGVELMEGFFDAIDLLEEVQTTAIREALRGNELENIDIDEFGFAFDEFESIEPLFEMFTEVMPDEYTEMVAAECQPFTDIDSFLFWALIDRDKLERSPVELLSKYQSNDVPNCTMIARVDTITQESVSGATDTDEIRPDGNDDDDVEFGKILHLADDLATNFGFKVEYPEIAVSPIAIYR